MEELAVEVLSNNGGYYKVLCLYKTYSFYRKNEYTNFLKLVYHSFQAYVKNIHVDEVTVARQDKYGKCQHFNVQYLFTCLLWGNSHFLRQMV